MSSNRPFLVKTHGNAKGRIAEINRPFDDKPFRYLDICVVAESFSIRLNQFNQCHLCSITYFIDGFAGLH